MSWPTIVARSCPGTTAPGRVPDVTGLRLDVAERELGARGLEYYVYAEDKVIIRSNWTVCDQFPAPGARAYPGVLLPMMRDQRALTWPVA